MTKIIIEESITSTIKTGVGKQTELLNNLITKTDYKYEIISNKLVEKIKNATFKRIIYLIWLNTFFVFKLLFEKQGTIVIYTSFLPFLKLKHIKQIGIIHDILVKINQDKMSKFSKINNILLNYLITKNTDKILTVSDTVKNEIAEYYNYPKEKLFLLYNSFSLDTDISSDENEILTKNNLTNNEYILSVSSLNPNKNISSLIKAFDKISNEYPKIKLVLSGGKNNISEQYKKLSNNKNIIFTGYVTNDDLKILYKNVLLYVFPSLYEGFGIPIIDAQRFGIPVLCSDIPVFHEVAGNGAEFANTDDESIAEKIKYLINNKTRQTELINNGYENIKRFSIDIIKQQFAKIIED